MISYPVDKSQRGFGFFGAEELNISAINGPDAPAVVYRAIPGLEFLEREFLPAEAILGPWFRSRCLVMLYAPRGIGKSYFALSCAYAIATGGEFLGWKAPKPVPVLYVDGEMAMHDLQERWSAIVAGDEKNDGAPEDFHLLAADDYEQGLPDLATEDGQRVILDALDAIGDNRSPRVLILDNLSTLSGIARENDGDEWVPIQRFLASLRRMNVSVILVHHAGRNGNARGTSRREDILDVVIALKRPDDYEPEQGARFEVRFEKTRGMAGSDASTIEARMSIGPQGALTWEHGAPTDKRGQAMEMFASGKKAMDVKVALGVSRSLAFQWQAEFKGG